MDPLAITVAYLPPAAVGSYYSAQLTTNGGGMQPLTWALLSVVLPGEVLSAPLPPGLSLSSGGAVTGVPMAASVNNLCMFQVTSADAQIAVGLVVVSVLDAPLFDPTNPNARFVNSGFWDVGC
jgi:hypothetical protein